MSQTQSKEFKRPQNVVRLKVNGAKNTVNTLRDEETGKGVSLVCPFPALEVDIPVAFGKGEATTKGAIHRIGVEDDPRTGLPRLRLAIRTEDTKTTVETNTGQSLLDATRVEDVEDVPAQIAGPMVRPLVSWADALGKNADTHLADGGARYDEFCDTEEPEWVDCREVPLPEEFLERSAIKKRYRVARHMVVAFVLGMLVAAGYLLDRSGMVSFSRISDRIIAFYSGESIESRTETKVEATEKTAVASVETALVEPPKKETAPLAEQTAVISPAIENTSYSTGANPLLDEAGETNVASEDAKEVVADGTAGESGADESNAENGEEEEATVADKGELSKDITLTLPTRWPVEYATAYRVRDPNGVVVDVPGGLVKREGWLENGRENPMIRSVKAIQRESGARFIVYVNGDLPRFMTSPKGNGVSLRLYYENDAENTTTVASLQ